MPSTYSTNLKLELQATGENASTWGTISNTNFGTALEQAIVGYGNAVLPSDANLTLTYTNSNAAQTARALVLNVTSAVSLSTTRELVVPTIQKQYIVQNNTTGSQSITVKTAAGLGVTIPNGRKAHLYVNGTDVLYMDDYVDINGGAIDGTPIGASSPSTGKFTQVQLAGSTSGFVGLAAPASSGSQVYVLPATDGTTGQLLSTNGSGVLSWSAAGTVTSVGGTGSVNGITLTGTVTSSGNLTLGGTLSGVDLTSQVTGTLPVANGGTGATTLAGANIPVTSAANTFTATQTFSGTSSTLGAVLNDAAETTTISATAATGTINYDVTTQSVLFYTTNASANWTVNLRGSAGTSMNTLLATGQSITMVFLVTNGSTPYYNTTVQVDGTTSGVTTRWQGGTAPSAGNASSVDAYTYCIVKTGSATFSVFASQTRFA